MNVLEKLLATFSPARIRARRLAAEKASRDLEILCSGGFACHACGDARPDEKIDVLSTMLKIDGVPAQWNRRYCVDRPACAEQVATQLAEIRSDAVNRKKEQP